MSDLPTFHTEKFTIRANEVDTQGNVTLKALCTFFQEVAGDNAKDLKFDITDLKNQDMTWVLHRMDIKIHRYPSWRETISIETWPAAGDSLRAYRNYRILGDDGTELGCCLSYWMMFNLKTRRPVRMTQEILDMRLSERDHVLPVKSNRISVSPEAIHKQTFNVRRSDLDMNMHVNNATYIDWMLECLPLDTVQSIQTFDIVYLQESVQGDVLSSFFDGEESGEIKIHLTNQNKKPIALCEVTLM